MRSSGSPLQPARFAKLKPRDCSPWVYMHALPTRADAHRQCISKFHISGWSRELPLQRSPARLADGLGSAVLRSRKSPRISPCLAAFSRKPPRARDDDSPPPGFPAAETMRPGTRHTQRIQPNTLHISDTRSQIRPFTIAVHSLGALPRRVSNPTITRWPMLVLSSSASSPPGPRFLIRRFFQNAPIRTGPRCRRGTGRLLLT